MDEVFVGTLIASTLRVSVPLILCALAGVLWLDLLSAAFLGQCARAFVIWAMCTTVLVSVAGAWVAFGRHRRHPA